jgi:hypothetical protein
MAVYTVHFIPSISRVRRVSVLASVMRKVIAKLAFMYGCIAFLLSTGWYVMALAGNAFWTLNPGAAATVIAIHGSVITLTFHREPLGNHWESVLAVTWRRIRAAKLLLWAAFLNFLLCFAFTLLYEARAVPLIVASLAVLSSAYIVLHWALRPENLFSEGFLQTMASPIRLFFRTRRPPRHLR